MPLHRKRKKEKETKWGGVGGFKTAKIRSSAVTNASVSAPLTEHFYSEVGASELRHSSVGDRSGGSY